MSFRWESEEDAAVLAREKLRAELRDLMRPAWQRIGVALVASLIAIVVSVTNVVAQLSGLEVEVQAARNAAERAQLDLEKARAGWTEEEQAFEMRLDALRAEEQRLKQVTAVVSAELADASPAGVSNTAAEAIIQGNTTAQSSPERVSGYIFLGNYSEVGGWSKPTFQWRDGEQRPRPDDMVSGSTLRVLGNMVLREALPPNTADYFHGVKVNGIVRRDTEVQLGGNPVGIKRAAVTQYWAPIVAAPESG